MLKCGPVELRVSFLLAPGIICVITIRAHLDRQIDEMGAVRRMLLAGALLTPKVLTEAEGLEDAADLCLFAPTVEAEPVDNVDWRELSLDSAAGRAANAASGQAAGYGTVWGAVGAKYNSKGLAAARKRIVLRFPRRIGVGAAFTGLAIGTSSPFEHGSCGQPEEGASSAEPAAQPPAATRQTTKKPRVRPGSEDPSSSAPAKRSRGNGSSSDEAPPE